jgi:hypothetical protein
VKILLAAVMLTAQLHTVEVEPTQSGYHWWNGFRPCATDEAEPETPPCYWDAERFGDGEGWSFTVWNGEAWYWETMPEDGQGGPEVDS